MARSSSTTPGIPRGVRLFLTCLITWGALAAPTARADQPSPTPSPPASGLVPRTSKPRVELVFVLDTTGSMSGLLEGAKRKVWSIASEVQRAKEQPDVRIGLVAYRDRGDSYVTRATPLTHDVDKVYAELMTLDAGGGGDTPEDVNAGLRAALYEMPWSEGNDALKMIFIVGDAPPHMDYDNASRWPELARSAVHRNIYINTVQCGADTETTRTWKDIAHAAEGRYAMIPQDGGVALAVVTPFDADLAGLARELDKTFLDYGSTAARLERKAARAGGGALAAKGPTSTAADRAAFKAKASASAQEDLVALAAELGSADAALARVDDAALPDDLRGQELARKRELIERARTNRDKLARAIADLEAKRSAYIAKQRAASGTSGDAFDAEVIQIVKTQGARSGLTY